MKKKITENNLLRLHENVAINFLDIRKKMRNIKLYKFIIQISVYIYIYIYTYTHTHNMICKNKPFIKVKKKI